jgi:hypothetical protein
MVARTDPGRRVAHGVLILLADAVLAGAALLAFVADAIERQGFASSGVTAAPGVSHHLNLASHSRDRQDGP